MINKKHIVSVLTVALIAGSLFTVSKPAYAAQGGMRGGNFFSDFITFISQKFGLDKTQVQTAMQDFQKQKQAMIPPRPTLSPQQMQDAEKKRLDPFVTQGKITQPQEDAIIAELATLRAKYMFDANTTPDQRKTQMAAMQNELKTWEQAQGINPSYVMMFGQGRGIGDGRMNGNFRGRGPRPSITP